MGGMSGRDSLSHHDWARGGGNFVVSVASLVRFRDEAANVRRRRLKVVDPIATFVPHVDGLGHW